MSFKEYLHLFNNARKSAMYGGEHFSLTEEVDKEVDESIKKVNEGKLSKLGAGLCYFLGSVVGAFNSCYFLAWYGVYKANKEKKLKQKSEELDDAVEKESLEEKIKV